MHRYLELAPMLTLVAFAMDGRIADPETSACRRVYSEPRPPVFWTISFQRRRSQPAAMEHDPEIARQVEDALNIDIIPGTEIMAQGIRTALRLRQWSQY
jgi:hypothetical protein